jgi:hypothetical protein
MTPVSLGSLLDVDSELCRRNIVDRLAVEGHR